MSWKRKSPPLRLEGGRAGVAARRAGAQRHNPVVVVEDDDDIRETFRELLETEGYTVLTARDGREALEVIAGLGGAPCLVLLDLMMPVMDGWQVLRALRSAHLLGRIPVVVVSAVPEEAEGAVRVMPKPVTVDELLRAVSEYA